MKDPSKVRGDGDRLRGESLRFLGDEDRSGDCQVFGQIPAPKDGVDDPDSWGGSNCSDLLWFDRTRNGVLDGVLCAFRHGDGCRLCECCCSVRLHRDSR